MITIKFLGGAKKLFGTPMIEVQDFPNTMAGLEDFLQNTLLQNNSQIDFTNMILAVNGAELSALDGMDTVLKDGDVISIIPVVHGGQVKRVSFTLLQQTIEIFIIKKMSDPIPFLESLRSNHTDVAIQAFQSKFVASLNHIKKVVLVSLYAQKTDTLLSNKIETDLLMRFAGTRQISEAISKIGVNQHSSTVLVAIGTKSLLNKLHAHLIPFIEDSNLPKSNSEFIKKEFKITRKELESVMSNTPLEDLLAERASVLFR